MMKSYSAIIEGNLRTYNSSGPVGSLPAFHGGRYRVQSWVEELRSDKLQDVAKKKSKKKKEQLDLLLHNNYYNTK